MTVPRDLSAPVEDMRSPGDMRQPVDMAPQDMPPTFDLPLPVDLSPSDMRPPGDLAPPRDMPAPNDLSIPPDMTSPSDLSVPPDMAGPHVTGLPTCTDVGVTADALFTGVAKTACANGGCHATGAAGLTFTSGTQLRTNTVGVASGQTTLMKLVTAGDIDRSYLMYKLVNQQAAAGGSGGIMPRGAGRLPDAQLCKFITWIKEGAK